jgi:hypothetical protein
MMEFDFETKDEQQVVITFHTNDDENIVLSVFDEEQWSLIEDMAAFIEKPIEDIVRDLDPSGPSVHVIDPDELEGYLDDDF